MVDMNPAGMFLMDLSSGTSMNPPAWPMPMTMHPVASWNTMFMGQAFLNDTQQSGPRGGDKFYSTNWFMANAEHKLGSKAAFQVNLMLSLEPVTITNRRYPLLFQTGETAYGIPLADAQHPHNFIMGLGLEYAYALSPNSTLELYAAPVGDPALGPTAYPHRASAMELPQATLSHHAQDSTHISDDVVTAGIAWRALKLEASGFHGAEPGENRWIIQQGKNRFPGRPASGISSPNTGPHKSPPEGSLTPKLSKPAIRPASPHRSNTRNPCRAPPGPQASSGAGTTTPPPATT